MKFSNSKKVRFANKYGNWALVTGASSGIGKALSRELAKARFNLVLTSRNELKLKQLASQFQLEYDIKVEFFAKDSSAKDGIDELLEFSKTFDIGLLVAAAGYGTSGLFIESNLEEEQNMLDLNCKSLFTLTHYFARKFADRDRGGIILMSSIAAFQGAPYASHYAATKAYVQALAEGLYHELKEVNVDILAAAPGPVNSGFADRANMKMGNALKPEEITIPILKALGRKSTVFPGFLTKILIIGLRTVPRRGKIKIMKLVMSSMTKHQQIEKN